MYVGLRDIKRFNIAATDGDIGVTKDFLFDDRTWAVRYMYVDTHKWLPLGEKVLISPVSLRTIDYDEEKIHVSLTIQQVKESPSADEHKPVSREYEALFFKYFGYGYYWTGPGVWGEYANPTQLAKPDMQSMEELAEIADIEKPKNHLRSIDELQGYDVNAKNTIFGLVYDLILDTENWVIPFVVIDTHNLFPGGKKVILESKHINSVNWLDHNVATQLSAQNIKECPEYDPELLNDKDYIDKVIAHSSLI